LAGVPDMAMAGQDCSSQLEDTPVAKLRSRSGFREEYRPRQQVVIFGMIRRRKMVNNIIIASNKIVGAYYDRVG
ncbi:hypothetical protein TorRG33x02_026610, partial [Trema orientale]